MRFRAGVNFGMWLSQYRAFDYNHFDTFLGREDFLQAAEWGFDHIRLPFDYPLLEDDNKPFEYSEKGFSYLDNCTKWAQEAGLDLLLDMHKAPGYSFSKHSESTLFDNKEQQDRYVSLWKTIARRYHNEGLYLHYELLNELVEKDSSRWNALAHRTIGEVRAIDPTHTIIFGGNNYNSASELKNIELSFDPGVIYTFHYYEPNLFTHQKAPWMEDTRLIDFQVPYPADLLPVKDYLTKHPDFQKLYPYFVDHAIDRKSMEHLLAPALTFNREKNRKVFCGEFGVYHIAEPADALRWLFDLTELLMEHDIPYSFWNYKSDDFGILKRDGSVRVEGLVDLLTRFNKP